MSSSSGETIELTAQCLCKAHSITASVPTSALPLQASYCHCSACRHMSGEIYASCVNWPGPAVDVHALSLRKYSFSQRTTILFCGTCSSPMFVQEKYAPWKKEEDSEGGQEPPKAFVGVLSGNAIPGMIQAKHHIFVDDTVDGGAAVWLRHLQNDKSSDAPIPCYRSWSHVGEYVDPDAMATASREKLKQSTSVPDEIPFYCHCKGVNLVLRSGVAEYSAMASSELPFFVNPSTLQLAAGFDACDSCRTSSPVDVVSRTFALFKHVDYAQSPSSASAGSSFPSNKQGLKAAVSSPDRDPRLGHLTYYKSSADVERYFCSNCSASVFFCVDSRPDTVTIAPGLLDAPEGARAESLLDWALGTMVFAGDVKGTWREELVDFIKINSEAWRVKNDIPLSWTRIANGGEW